MTYRLQPWTCLSLLLLAACDRPEKTGEGSGEAGSGPPVTRSHRPPREVLPDKKEELRRELARSETIRDPEERDKVLVQVAWNALEVDPELAREALERLMMNSDDRIALIQHFAMRMADENPDEALKWAASLESEREAAAARVRIALVLADKDPARAGELLSEYGLANREFEVAVVQVLQRWTEKTPQDAAAWVELFPPGEFRKAGVEAVVSGWLVANPQAAFSWLSAVADEQIRMEAVDVIAKRYLQQTPEIRESWLSHADPGLREKIANSLRDQQR
jgi:hypothetical protein